MLYSHTAEELDALLPAVLEMAFREELWSRAAGRCKERELHPWKFRFDRGSSNTCTFITQWLQGQM